MKHRDQGWQTVSSALLENPTEPGKLGMLLTWAQAHLMQSGYSLSIG